MPKLISGWDSEGYLSTQKDLLDFHIPTDGKSRGCVVTSCEPTIVGFKETMAAHTKFVDELTKNSRVKIVRSQSDLIDDGRIAVIPRWQHFPAGMTRENVRTMKEAGILFATLSYGGPTPYGGGCYADASLTVEGKRRLVWMAEAGIQPDLSHLGHEMSRSMLRFIEAEHLPLVPVVTHSGCSAVYDHPRNLPDDILWKVSVLGGYVGIPLMSFMLAKPDTDEKGLFVAWNKHVGHAMQMCGGNNVGIGSDSWHFDMTLSEAKEVYDYLMGLLPPGKRPPDVQFPDRPESIILKGGKMFDVIKERSYFDGGLFGGNCLSYLLRSLPA